MFQYDQSSTINTVIHVAIQLIKNMKSMVINANNRRIEHTHNSTGWDVMK